MKTINDVRFFKGGKAIFTVDNGKGTHYTYRISHKDDTQPLFVSLMTGSDNENSYTYLGILNPVTNEVRLTQKSKMTDEQSMKLSKELKERVAKRHGL